MEYLKSKRSETHNKDNCQILEDCVYWYAQELLFQGQSQRDCMNGKQKFILARLFDPVYITLTSMKLIGNHAFASCIL